MIDRYLPLDVISMSEVVSLHLFISIIQNYDGGDEVDNFTGR